MEARAEAEEVAADNPPEELEASPAVVLEAIPVAAEEKRAEDEEPVVEQQEEVRLEKQPVFSPTAQGTAQKPPWSPEKTPSKKLLEKTPSDLGFRIRLSQVQKERISGQILDVEEDRKRMSPMKHHEERSVAATSELRVPVNGILSRGSRKSSRVGSRSSSAAPIVEENLENLDACTNSRKSNRAGFRRSSLVSGVRPSRKSSFSIDKSTEGRQEDRSSNWEENPEEKSDAGGSSRSRFTKTLSHSLSLPTAFRDIEDDSALAAAIASGAASSRASEDRSQRRSRKSLRKKREFDSDDRSPDYIGTSRPPSRGELLPASSRSRMSVRRASGGSSRRKSSSRSKRSENRRASSRKSRNSSSSEKSFAQERLTPDDRVEEVVQAPVDSDSECESESEDSDVSEACEVAKKNDSYHHKKRPRRAFTDLVCCFIFMISTVMVLHIPARQMWKYRHVNGWSTFLSPMNKFGRYCDPDELFWNGYSGFIVSIQTNCFSNRHCIPGPKYDLHVAVNKADDVLASDLDANPHAELVCGLEENSDSARLNAFNSLKHSLTHANEDHLPEDLKMERGLTKFLGQDSPDDRVKSLAANLFSGNVDEGIKWYRVKSGRSVLEHFFRVHQGKEQSETWGSLLAQGYNRENLCPIYGMDKHFKSYMVVLPTSDLKQKRVDAVTNGLIPGDFKDGGVKFPSKRPKVLTPLKNTCMQFAPPTDPHDQFCRLKKEHIWKCGEDGKLREPEDGGSVEEKRESRKMIPVLDMYKNEIQCFGKMPHDYSMYRVGFAPTKKRGEMPFFTLSHLPVNRHGVRTGAENPLVPSWMASLKSAEELKAEEKLRTERREKRRERERADESQRRMEREERNADRARRRQGRERQGRLAERKVLTQRADKAEQRADRAEQARLEAEQARLEAEEAHLKVWELRRNDLSEKVTLKRAAGQSTQDAEEELGEWMKQKPCITARSVRASFSAEEGCVDIDHLDFGSLSEISSDEGSGDDTPAPFINRKDSLDELDPTAAIPMNLKLNEISIMKSTGSAYDYYAQHSENPEAASFFKTKLRPWQIDKYCDPDYEHLNHDDSWKIYELHVMAATFFFKVADSIADHWRMILFIGVVMSMLSNIFIIIFLPKIGFLTVFLFFIGLLGGVIFLNFTCLYTTGVFGDFLNPSGNFWQSFGNFWCNCFTCGNAGDNNNDESPEKNTLHQTTWHHQLYGYVPADLRQDSVENSNWDLSAESKTHLHWAVTIFVGVASVFLVITLIHLRKRAHVALHLLQTVSSTSFF